MATDTAAQNGAKQAEAESPLDKLLMKEVSYTPFGEKESIDLKYGHVARYLAKPTKSGKHPSQADIINFMMLCKARELNPWAGDAYLTGYDSKSGPQFSLVTAIQALLKRAEACPAFDGIESGVIVRTEEGAVEYREGDFKHVGEELLGGWAKCYRKDRAKVFYDALNLSVYTTGRSRWEKDPAGMIVKCAESSVLRQAFPTQLGGLYTREEMEHRGEADAEAFPTGAVQPSDGLAGLMGVEAEEPDEAPPEGAPIEPTGVGDTVGAPPSVETPEERADREQLFDTSAQYE